VIDRDRRDIMMTMLDTITIVAKRINENRHDDDDLEIFKNHLKGLLVWVERECDD